MYTEMRGMRGLSKVCRRNNLKALIEADTTSVPLGKGFQDSFHQISAEDSETDQMPNRVQISWQVILLICPKQVKFDLIL